MPCPMLSNTRNISICLHPQQTTSSPSAPSPIFTTAAPGEQNMAAAMSGYGYTATGDQAYYTGQQQAMVYTPQFAAPMANPQPQQPPPMWFGGQEMMMPPPPPFMGMDHVGPPMWEATSMGMVQMPTVPSGPVAQVMPGGYGSLASMFPETLLRKALEHYLSTQPGSSDVDAPPLEHFLSPAAVPYTAAPQPPKRGARGRRRGAGSAVAAAVCTGQHGAVGTPPATANSERKEVESKRSVPLIDIAESMGTSSCMYMNAFLRGCTKKRNACKYPHIQEPCGVCGQADHLTSKCPTADSTVCDHCKHKGHTQRVCPHLFKLYWEKRASLTKRAICHFYNTEGGCRNGMLMCAFAHRALPCKRCSGTDHITSACNMPKKSEVENDEPADSQTTTVASARATATDGGMAVARATAVVRVRSTTAGGVT